MSAFNQHLSELLLHFKEIESNETKLREKLEVVLCRAYRLQNRSNSSPFVPATRGEWNTLFFNPDLLDKKFVLSPDTVYIPQPASTIPSATASVVGGGGAATTAAALAAAAAAPTAPPIAAEAAAAAAAEAAKATAAAKAAAEATAAAQGFELFKTDKELELEIEYNVQKNLIVSNYSQIKLNESSLSGIDIENIIPDNSGEVPEKKQQYEKILQENYNLYNNIIDKLIKIKIKNIFNNSIEDLNKYIYNKKVSTNTEIQKINKEYRERIENKYKKISKKYNELFIQSKKKYDLKD